MIDSRVGKRIKECRERLGLTQEEFAEKAGFTTNYISTIERGASFPRYEPLVRLLNGLQVSADEIFCDVLEYSTPYTEKKLCYELSQLHNEAQRRIMKMVELMIKAEKELVMESDCEYLYK